MEKFGFVGLPNAGKSSLYNALAGGGALAAPYAFATKDPNVGVAKVPDHRLEKLAIMSATKSVIPASVQFVDIGGLVEGASTGEGLGNKFLANIRESDAIVFVLRAFEDDDVPGPSDPLEHLRIVEIELALADLETVENQIEKRRKAAKQDRFIADEVEALGKALVILSEGTPLYRSDLDAESRDLIKSYFLLTNKPVLAIVNVSENDLDRIDEKTAAVIEEFGGHGEVIGMCVQLEAEAAMLDADERVEMLEGLGLGGSSMPPTECSDSARTSPPARKKREHGRSGLVTRPRSAQASSIPILSAGSFGPKSSIGMNCSRSGPGRKPAMRASFELKARTTSLSMVT